MFLTLSRFNSGCRPCLSRPQYNEKDRTFSLYAVRDIKAGEELVWPYLGVRFSLVSRRKAQLMRSLPQVPFEFDSIESRREELLRCFHFDCSCDACKRWQDPAELKASNGRLLKLRRLKEGLSSESGGRQGTLRRMIALAEEEQLWEMAQTLAKQLEKEEALS